MKFDVDWLIEHLDESPELDDLADRLTSCGFLVELRERIEGGEVWDVEVTTNRPDAMNHRGLAREAATALGCGLKPFGWRLTEHDEPADSLATVVIAEPELCSRYVARIVRDVTIGGSPEWLQRRLDRCGIRPINAVVDATNFVLLDLGQPLHAFDLARLADQSIEVRRARPDETLTTLDGQSRRLDDGVLVIADGRQAVAIAGIMGGADTEIGVGTRDVLIESAHFDPLTVRRGARRLGMHTEASHRFERGCDPEMAAVACDAAAVLIADLTGGRVCRGRIDAYPRPGRSTRLTLSVPQLSAFAGLEIKAQQVTRILRGLEFEPELDGEHVTVTVPPHRVDVEREPDLCEEVLRHVGYGAVPSQLPPLPTPPGHRSRDWELVDRAREAAVAAGLTEVMTWAFIDPELDLLVDGSPLCPGDQLSLDNPLAQTQATMRRSLLPGMLGAARSNFNQGERSLAMFEQGRVFALRDGKTWEGERIAVLLSGAAPDGGELEFVDAKGAVEEILHRVAFPPVTWHSDGEPWLDGNRGARIEAEGARIVGCAGRLAASMADRWQFRQPVYIAELDLGLALSTPPPIRFRPLPRFPSVTADITVEHAASLTFAELISAARELASECVEVVELSDRFTGDQLPPDTVRTTLRLVYRHPERSLTQEEVNTDQTRLRELLAGRLGIRFA